MSFKILGNAQEQASSKIQSLETVMPADGGYPEADALAHMKGTLPDPNSLKNDFKTKTPEEKVNEDDIPSNLPEEETPDTKILTQSEMWMEDNFPVIHENIGYVIEFQLTNKFPDDKRYKRFIKNPQGKYSTSVKERSKKHQKEFGKFEEIFDKDERKGLNTFHKDKDWPEYIRKIEKRLGLDPTYAGPPLSNYDPETQIEPIVIAPNDKPENLGIGENTLSKEDIEKANQETEVKVEKYKERQEQIKTTEEKSIKIKDKLTKLNSDCTGGLALGTSMISISDILGKMDNVLKLGAKAGDASTKPMKPTYPSHPGPGNLNKMDGGRKADDMKNKSDGFSTNLKQQLNNLGSFLKDIIDKIKAFLKKIIPILAALIAIIALCKFLQQLLEFLFLAFLKNSSESNQSEDKANNAENPDEFLASIGYPGYEDGDSGTIKDEDGNIIKDPIKEEETTSPRGADLINEANLGLLGMWNYNLTESRDYQSGGYDSGVGSGGQSGGLNQSTLNTTQDYSIWDSNWGSQYSSTSKPPTGWVWNGGESKDPSIIDTSNALGASTHSDGLNQSGTDNSGQSGTCSIPGHTTKETCEAAGGIWTPSDTPILDHLAPELATNSDLNSDAHLNKPLIIGGTEIGIPVTDPTLNFNNHSLAGDISDIHPNIINELYEEGILPKETTDSSIKDPSLTYVPQAETYEKALGDYYNEVIKQFKRTNKIEYIEKIYDAKFKYVGYRRYKA